mmetsp:Transcript_23370/g.51617  ORF Transcript_23370/g.51617 Transcript_23370/m.51617 type:complete len:361 (+) Transcript_23370:33-1115(+)
MSLTLKDVMAIGTAATACLLAGTWSCASALLGTCKALATDIGALPALLPGIPVAAGSTYLWHPLPGTLAALPEPEGVTGRQMPKGGLDMREATAQVLGQIYRCGGCSSLPGLRGYWPKCSLECFDQLSQSWAPLPQMSRRREAHSATALLGKLYVCGGIDEAAIHASAECFDPASVTWRELPSMAFARFDHAAAALRGKLYVCGGLVGKADGVASMERFDPARSCWTPMPSMTGRRATGGHRAAGLRGKLYVLSNAHDDGNVPVECFDLSKALWAILGPMPIADPSIAKPGGKFCKLNLEVTAWQGMLYVAHSRWVGPARTPLDSMLRLDPGTGVWEPRPCCVYQLSSAPAESRLHALCA